MKRLGTRGTALLLAGWLTLTAGAQIYNWNTGEVIPGTEGMTPGPGMDLGFWNTDGHNLDYADLSGGLDLHGSTFRASDVNYGWFTDANLTDVEFAFAELMGADFSGADLTDADLGGTTLTGANFSGATVNNASFSPGSYGTGLTMAQLYSTASYAAGDLHGVSLSSHDVTGWDFSGMNLFWASFRSGVAGANFSGADLTRADLTHAVLTGADFTGAIVARALFARSDMSGGTGLTAAQLYSTASYAAGNLYGIGLGNNDLTGWDLSGQDLTQASLYGATFTGTDLTGATIREAHLASVTDHGFTAEHLYATASYQAGDLYGIVLMNNDLAGWNFAGQDLMGAYMPDADLTGADLRMATMPYAIVDNVVFDGADCRDALMVSLLGYGPSFVGADFRRADLRHSDNLSFAGAIVDNAILPDSRIDGLNLVADETLYIRDFAQSMITVDEEMVVGAGAALEMVLDDADWRSTLALADGVAAYLDGVLRLSFAADADVDSLVGVTFDLFDWNGGLPGRGGLTVETEPWATWDLSDLYGGGTVTLLGVPEPGALALLAVVALVARPRR